MSDSRLLSPAPQSTAADEQNVGGIDLHEILVGMLAPAIWRVRWPWVPSMSLSSACHPPHLTSRVMDGLSDLQEILSISSI